MEEEGYRPKARVRKTYDGWRWTHNCRPFFYHGSIQGVRRWADAYQYAREHMGRCYDQ